MGNNNLTRFVNSTKNFEKQILNNAGKTKKKRIKLTSGQRLHIWEHPKLYGRACGICHQRITKASDLELDHTKAHSKGGTKLALTHKHCNRMKASGSLHKIQKALGIKTKKRKTTSKKTKRKTKQRDPFDFTKW